MTGRDDARAPDDRYARALAVLPDAYAAALRWRDVGVATDEICRRLDIEPEALEPLLEVARRKLSAALALEATIP